MPSPEELTRQPTITTSPLALPFNKALVVRNFSKQIKAWGESTILEGIRENCNAELRSALNATKFVVDRRGIQVVFKNGIPEGARLMTDKTGEVLPTLVDGKTNKIIQNARKLGKGAEAAKLGAAAPLAVVEVAHIISGHDNAKRLKKIEIAVERLVHAHESELKAKLEGIYRQSKEILSGGIGNLSREDKDKLHSYCRELIETRARWRDDFLFRLNQIQRAKPAWINRALHWKKERSLERSRRQQADKLNQELECIQLMNFSLTLQTLLAAAADRGDEFRRVTLKDECMAWAELHECVEDRVMSISAGDSRPFAPFLTQLENTSMIWSDCVLIA